MKYLRKNLVWLMPVFLTILVIFVLPFWLNMSILVLLVLAVIFFGYIKLFDEETGEDLTYQVGICIGVLLLTILFKSMSLDSVEKPIFIDMQTRAFVEQPSHITSKKVYKKVNLEKTFGDDGWKIIDEGKVAYSWRNVFSYTVCKDTANMAFLLEGTGKEEIETLMRDVIHDYMLEYLRDNFDENTYDHVLNIGLTRTLEHPTIKLRNNTFDFHGTISLRAFDPMYDE